MKEATGGLAYSLYAYDNAPRPTVTINIGGVDQSTPGTSAPTLSTWTHLAGTYDGAALRLFVNGTQVATRALSGSMRTSTSPLRIGGNAIWGEYFQGLIDEVRIYNRALTASEIQTDMNAPVDPGPPDTQPPTAPTGLTATGSVGTATLAWTAATDNKAVVNYNVHRSTTAGFVPAAVNRVAQPASTGYTDTGLAAGTYYYRVTAQDAAGNVGPASNEASAAVTADTTPPTVSMTAPAAGATVSGGVTVSATASDNVGVVGVQFLLDGLALGAEDTTAPYSITWDSRTASNGTHTLAARARDAAGNQTTSTAISVVVSNAALPGPIAAYGFNEGTGTTSADRSGNANTATITGATWTNAGKYGKALSFDGLSNWVTVADTTALHLTTGMTIEAWVNPTNLSGWRSVILKETPTDLAYGLYANDNVPQPAGTIRVGTTTYEALGSAVPLNTWTHLAATYDGTTLWIYVNGALSGSRAISGSIVTSTNALRIGGNAVWGEYFAGVIDEVRIYNRALPASEIQTDMNTPVEPSAPDTTPPTITRTVPAAAATGVSPAASLHVTFSEAIDAQSLTGAIELRDASNQVVSAAISYDGPTWTARLTPSNTLAPSQTYTAVVKGGTVDPRVKDGAGNALAATSTWTFTTSADTVPRGQWSAVVTWPVVAVHQALLHTGKVLIWQDVGGTSAYVGDPVTGVFKQVPTPGNSDIYCAGLSTLADGRLAVVGGHGATMPGLPDFNIFDPVTEQWTAGPKMSRARWYPSAVTLPDGRLLAVSGGSTWFTCLVDVPEVYDPAANTWTTLSSAVWAAPYYPLTFVAPDGRVVYAGATEQKFETRALNVATQTWSVLDPVVVDGGSGVMYRPGKILKSGTARDTADPVIPAEKTVYLLDTTQSTTTWRQTLPMAYGRTYHNLVILPDGSVLATGGESTTDGIDLTHGVLQAELWSPDTESWTTMAAMKTSRLYHSTSVLLPDGRVVAAGGGAKNQVAGATDQPNAEIYSPPYLFRGARPTITSAPQVVAYGSAFTVNTPDTVASVSLIRTGATTHDFDENQRFLSLAFQPVAGGVSVTAPANANLAPPGYYMLFILNGAGVPSVASFVRVAAPSNPTSGGLVAAYGFNEGTGTTVADSSAVSGPGTISGATWTTAGKFGSALSFDGTTSWVTIADSASLHLTTGMTLEAWVNPTALSGWRSALLKEITGGLTWGLYANNNTPNPAVTVRIGTDQTASGTAALALNTWSHLAASYDGAQLRLYVNGVQVGSRAQTGSMAVSTGPLRIGGNSVWGEYFAGLIDEVRIYNRALTAAEIQADMNAAIR
jgi:hypothetical protein